MEKLYFGRGKDCDNAALISFINGVFFTDDPSNREFLEILPKIYKDKYRPAYSNFVVQDENTREFRSAIGNFYCDMTAGGETMKACCIGNVAVGTKFRGMGYMKKLMQMSVEDMKANGTALAYLGGQRQRYGYFGFEHAGVSFEFGFGPNCFRHSLHEMASGFECAELSPEDIKSLEVIKKINDLKPVHAARPVDDLDDILRSWRQKPFTVKENGETVGYIVFNREMNAVCEFGIIDFDKLDRIVAACFETARKVNPGTGLRFFCGSFEKEKIDFFTKNCDGIDMGGCEMILVLDYEKVIRAYLKAEAQYKKLADGCVTVLIHGENGDENLTITVKDNAVGVEKTDNKPDVIFSHKEATRAFFSLYPNEREVFPPEVKSWLPLPMYQNGCDTM